MGFFSPRERTTVGTSISRVIEDKFIADPGKVGVIKAILKNTNISEALSQELAASIGTRAERMYEYGGNGYAFGLPSGEFYTASQGLAQIQAVLNSIAGQEVQIEYNRLGPANILHMGWMKIIADLGYNPSTNQIDTLSATKAREVYLKDMVVVVPTAKLSLLSPVAIEQWGLAPTTGTLPYGFERDSLVSKMVGHSLVQSNNTISTEAVLVTYVWGNPASPYNPITEEGAVEANMLFGSVTLPIAAPDPQAEYFHVKYIVNNQSYYWMYKLGAGTYPSLDAIFNSPPTTTGEFFPIAYFRLNKTPVNNNLTSPNYKTSKKLLKYLGINYDQLVNSINQNPDIDDVEQAMLIMAVPANTDNPLEQRYLFDFFDKLRLNQTNTYNSFNEGKINSILFDWTRNVIADTILIQDNASKMALSNGGIYKRRLGGTIGSRGSYASDTGIKFETVRMTASGDSGTDYDQTFSIFSHYYRKQVSDSMYDEIEVINLRTTFKVYQEYESIGDDTDEILIVPIDRTVTQAYSTSIKNSLYSQSLHYVFNSRIISYTYFYQSGLFQFIIIAIALATALYSVGQSLYLAAAALAAGTTTMTIIIITMLISVLETILIGITLAYIAKKVGPGVAIALALLAAAYGLSGNGFSALPSLPFADTLLNVSVSMIKAVGDYYSNEIAGIQAAFDELAIESAKVSALINQAQDLLADNLLLSPLTIIGESADDYYRRTMYSGDVGAVAIGSINTFYERALALPTLADSFGDMLS